MASTLVFVHLNARLRPDDRVALYEDQLQPYLDARQQVLAAFGAPRGSTLTVPGQAPVPFGVLEGVAVYLNGTDLAPTVYAASDVNELIDSVLEALGEEGFMQSYWEGPRETALSLYGPSAGALRARLAGVLAAHPLAERCRVADIA